MYMLRWVREIGKEAENIETQAQTEPDCETGIRDRVHRPNLGSSAFCEKKID